MPHLHLNNIAVVTQDELVPQFFKKLDTLMQNIHRHTNNPNYGIKRIQKGGGGHPALYAYDSLPKEIQLSLGDPRKTNHILERYYKIDGRAVTFFDEFTFEDDGSYLDLKYQYQYVINASVLKAIYAYKIAAETERIAKNMGTRGIIGQLCDDAQSFQNHLKVKYNTRHTLPANKESFSRTMRDFDNDSYRSLISGKHKNENSRKVTSPVMSLLNNMFADERSKPTATEIHRRYKLFLDGFHKVVNKATGEDYNPSEFKPLATKTVTNYLLNWKNSIGTFAARSGDRQKWMQEFKPSWSFSKPVKSGSIISIDDRQPPFKTDSGKRIWFYNAIDIASQAFVCWVYAEKKADETKDEKLIISFYRQLVRNFHEWNLPLPYELEAEMSLNSAYLNTFLRDGAMFQETKIEANNARGKRIERFYRDLRYGIEKKREGWLARPHALSEANQPGPAKVPTLEVNEIVNNAFDDIETWNNTPHPDAPELTRWEYFVDRYDHTLPATNYKSFLPYIGFCQDSSCHAGLVRFQSAEWMLGVDGQAALGDTLISLMEEIEGRDIDIYYLKGNDGKLIKALVFAAPYGIPGVKGLHSRSQYICELYEKPKPQRAANEKTPIDKELETIQAAYTNTVTSFARRQYAALDEVAYIETQPAKPKSFTIPRNFSSDSRSEEVSSKYFSLYDDDLDTGGIVGFDE